MKDRPNILLVMADQMRADCLGAAGHPVVQTPHLDRLASSGTLYANAYCNSPVCAPSRASFATGQLVRRCAAYDNAAELSSEIPTIYHRLRAEGYETVGSGKFHFVGADQLHGLERRLTTDIFPANFAWTPDWAAGALESEGMNGSVVKRAREVPSNVYIDFDEEVLFRSREFIRGRGRDAGRERPFFLQVSFSHPHPPFEPLRHFLGLYPHAVPPPAIPELPENPTLYEQWMITLNRLAADPLSAERTNFARRCYYAMVSYVDHMVGLLLDELDRHRLSENTVVIFTSDHGEMLGEKGLWYKRMYHEPSVRVPLVFHDPRTDHGAVRQEQVVSLVDLAAEILRIAGVEIPSDLDGGGLWTPGGAALFEYFGKGTLAPLFGIRRDQWKLVEIPGHMTLLYDLEHDPNELSDLAAGDSVRVASLRDELYGDLDLDLLVSEIVSSQARRLELRELHAGNQPAWDYQPHFSAGERYIRPARGS